MSCHNSSQVNVVERPTSEDHYRWGPSSTSLGRFRSRFSIARATNWEQSLAQFLILSSLLLLALELIEDISRSNGKNLRLISKIACTRVSDGIKESRGICISFNGALEVAWDLKRI